MKKVKTGTRARLVDSPNCFERDFGNNLRKEQIDKISEILKNFMEEARALQQESVAKLKKAQCGNLGSQCSSCALNPLTDTWNGFIPTAYGFLWAIHNDKLFLCHANQPEWMRNKVRIKNMKVCEGFFHIMAVKKPESRWLADKTMTAIREIASH